MTTYATPEPISVTIDVGISNIRVAASDRTDTVVEVRPTDPSSEDDRTAAEQTRVEYASGRLSIRGPKGLRHWGPRAGRESIEVDIQLPEGSHLTGDIGVASLDVAGRIGHVDFRSGVGDIRLGGCAGVRVKTGAGDVRVGAITGEAEVRTGTGRVELGAIGGRAVIKNSSGETRIGDAGGDVRVQSANGGIFVDRSRSTVIAKTSLGDINIGEASGGRIEARTACGRVEIGVPEGVAAWLELHTTFGQVKNDLDAVDRPQPGDQTVEIRASTSMGDIAVHRVAAPVPG